MLCYPFPYIQIIHTYKFEKQNPYKTLQNNNAPQSAHSFACSKTTNLKFYLKWLIWICIMLIKIETINILRTIRNILRIPCYPTKLLFIVVLHLNLYVMQHTAEHSPNALKQLTKSPEEVIYLLSIAGFGGCPLKFSGLAVLYLITIGFFLLCHIRLEVYIEYSMHIKSRTSFIIWSLIW